MVNHLSCVFLYKIILTLLAILFNVVCVYVVIRGESLALSSSDLVGMKSAETVKSSLIIPTFWSFCLALYIAW